MAMLSDFVPEPHFTGLRVYQMGWEGTGRFVDRRRLASQTGQINLCLAMDFFLIPAPWREHRLHLRVHAEWVFLSHRLSLSCRKRTTFSSYSAGA